MLWEQNIESVVKKNPSSRPTVMGNSDIFIVTFFGTARVCVSQKLPVILLGLSLILTCT